MNWQRRATLLTVLVLGALLAGCRGATIQTGAAPTSVEFARSQGQEAVPHQPGEAHPFQPARLQAVIHIEMGEMYFGDLAGERNPTYRLPADTTVGIHIHNEGVIRHELAVGRTIENGEYAELLTQLVPSDLFFYYGRARVEVEDATFGEVEVDPGIREMWIRMNVPDEFKGEWEIGCFVEGHYEAGMHARLIV